MSALDIHSTILVYGDAESATNNPKRRFMDWTRHTTGVLVEQPSIREYEALPGETLSIFSGTRTLLVDGTTEFSLALNTVRSGVYRMTRTSGTTPGFRTARAYSPNGILHTLTVNNNSTLEMVCASGSFTGAGIVAGDNVYLPGATTGDSASVFNSNNIGRWVVLAATATKLTLVRPSGESFNGVSEAVTPTSNGQILVFSAAGVQIGDTIEISAGFSSVTCKSFVVSDVTATWLEFSSGEALPLETGITPTASGLTVYNESKRFVRVEVDQEAVIRINGDTGNTLRVSPRTPADPDATGYLELAWGPIWSLSVVNRSSTASMVVNVISAE